MFLWSSKWLLPFGCLCLIYSGCGRLGFSDSDIERDADSQDADSQDADSQDADSWTPEVCPSEPLIFSEARLYEFTIPEDCSDIRLDLWGAGGGAGGSNEPHSGGHGGGGAFVSVEIESDPGANLVIIVGGAGRQGVDTIIQCGPGGGGGGGASLAFLDGELIAVAGGGGGGGGAGAEQGLDGEVGLLPAEEEPLLTIGGTGSNGTNIGVGIFDCEHGFGGAGGFAREASGGTGGCRAGSGGSGGGAPGGAASLTIACMTGRYAVGGHGGNSFAVNPLSIESGLGRNPGHDEESDGAGFGGNGEAEPPSGGAGGRAVLAFER